MLFVTAALLLKLRSIQAVRRRPIKGLQLVEALRAGQRALAVLPQRAPWSRLVNEPLTPEVLEIAPTDRALGRPRGIEVPHIDAERIEQFVLIAMPNMGEESFPRRRFRPEVAWRAIRLLMSQSRKDSLS